MHQGETSDFWVQYPVDDLSTRVAALHQQRRLLLESLPAKEVEIARRTVSALFIHEMALKPAQAHVLFRFPRRRNAFMATFATANS
jgi:hypothetical protein